MKRSDDGDINYILSSLVTGSLLLYPFILLPTVKAPLFVSINAILDGSSTMDSTLDYDGIGWYSMVLHGIRWYCRLLHGI